MKRILLLCAIVVQLVACAGGGGGSGASPGGGESMPPVPVPTPTPDPYLRTEVPFATPVKIATVDPLANVDASTGFKYAVTDTFTADIQGTGGQDVIIAGRMTQPSTTAEWGNNKIHMMGWENGVMVDKTAQWFPEGINEIKGTEPSVKFADFFKTGRQDMFVAPSTDSTNLGPGYLFTNQGNKFSRQSFNLNIWSHDSAVADLDGDTYKDVLLTDYGPNTTMLINNRVNSFTALTDSRGSSGDLRWGGSAVAVADFVGNGSKQLIITDNACNTSNPGCTGASSTKMYTWTVDTNANNLQFNFHSELPKPRFDLPKWAGYGFAGSHSVRAAAHDFNDDGRPDAILFSMPVAAAPDTDTKYSEVQFLANQGTGSFADVTDTTLVGYNHRTYVTYNPKFLDLNGDGKIDILVSGHDYTGQNNSTQFLLKSNDGKYVAAYQNILTDFATQVNTIQNTSNTGNTVNLLKGPDGKLYLLSAVSFMNGADRQLAVYMSPLGNQSTTTAQQAVDLILQKWPYMTVPQANDALARTAPTYFGGRMIDLEALMNPIGTLDLPTVRGLQPIQGFIAGVNLDNGQVVGVDDLNRSFNLNIKGMNVSRMNMFNINMEHNDSHEITSHAEYLVAGPKYTMGSVRVGTEDRNNFNGYGSGDPTLVGRQFNNYTVGVPNWWRKGGLSFGTQYTALNQNPWISMGGAWGNVTNSQIMDNVVTYRNSGFSVQGSLMYVTTSIQPGLITNVRPATGGWAETGYRYTNWKDRHGDMGIYFGVKPVIFSGSVEANLPTGVDNTGNVVYTKKTMSIQNQTTTYVRALYTNRINKQSQYRVSGMLLDNGQYRVMNEIRWWLQ
jgi:hypothetical protein